MSGYKVRSNKAIIDIPADDDVKQPVVNKAKKVKVDSSTVKKAKKVGMTAHAYFKLFKVHEVKRARITHRGPCTKGDENYDKHCVFADNVEMTDAQIENIIAQVAGYKPSIPYYVCRMTMSNVVTGKAKMCFSSRYSNAHLNQHLPRELLVICSDQASFQHVRFIHGKKNVAQMTSNWTRVVDAAGIKAGDLCIFTFLNVGQLGFMCHVVCLN